ncbi:MAG: TIGR04282 family arsenosugar biosynthesis glycosyltransferase [Thermodesulfovibrionales bacterium]|nr:TIGR04282 family arsenosugar biosynthesis glycosyltransferase [Thermodesulfovibrionales bacterium]
MAANPSALGIMFRIPEYGRVKTRLAKEVGKGAALRAYISMLNTTLLNISELKNIDIYGFYKGKEPLNWNDNIRYHPQSSGDIGERMLNAIQWLFKKGYYKVTLIGADSPDLPLSFITRTFSELDNYDLVIGPSEDGGYYLIGMKNPQKVLFKSIRWGSSSAFKDTVSIAKKEGIKYVALPQWYDIDSLSALNKWRRRLNLPDFCPKSAVNGSD